MELHLCDVCVPLENTLNLSALPKYELLQSRVQKSCDGNFVANRNLRFIHTHSLKHAKSQVWEYERQKSTQRT